ncbi:MAG: dTDP-glucose 4,6-dehydratase [Candidatus Omnitrophica bacterium]|nr:dTDP-glucose 4,6-dehydratase [Candidatus Omnitrophota bacterium]
MKKGKILVTGGAGFIGSAFVKSALKRGFTPVVLDKLTYSADLERLKELKDNFGFYKCDITAEGKLKDIFNKENPVAVLNFAAESHVDRSIRDSSRFIETNIMGTRTLLDAAKESGINRFIHISTDEVYGEITKGRYTETSPLNPGSPYSASKAAADLIIKSYERTYDFPSIIVRPCNNYGPWQYPEKLIPLCVLKVIRNEKIPVYADGKNVREWMHVDDCVEAIMRILEKGKIHSIYNLGSGHNKQNIEVVSLILESLKKDKSCVKFVKDRPGHDMRYSLDSEKVLKDTGWRPKIGFKDGLEATIDWCTGHKNWLLSKWRKIAPLYR